MSTHRKNADDTDALKKNDIALVAARRALCCDSTSSTHRSKLPNSAACAIRWMIFESTAWFRFFVDTTDAHLSKPAYSADRLNRFTQRSTTRRCRFCSAAMSTHRKNADDTDALKKVKPLFMIETDLSADARTWRISTIIWHHLLHAIDTDPCCSRRRILSTARRFRFFLRTQHIRSTHAPHAIATDALCIRPSTVCRMCRCRRTSVLNSNQRPKADPIALFCNRSMALCTICLRRLIRIVASVQLLNAVARSVLTMIFNVLEMVWCSACCRAVNSAHDLKAFD